MTSDDAESNKDAAAADKPDLAKADSPAEESAKTPDPKSDAPEPKAAGATAASATDDKAGAGARNGWLAAAVAGVVAVGAVTAAVVFYLQSDSRGDKLDAISESTKAACEYGKVATNFDYSNNIDEYFEAMKAGAAGDNLEQFTTAGDALKSLIIEQQVKSRSEDVQCAYISGGDDEVKAMVTFAQYRTNITGTDDAPVNIAIEMTLERDGDKWLVNSMDSPVLKSGGGLPGGGVPSGGGAPGGETTPGGEAPAPAPGN